MRHQMIPLPSYEQTGKVSFYLSDPTMTTETMGIMTLLSTYMIRMFFYVC